MFLEGSFSREEIKQAVWDCGVDRAPGPDEFTFEFFKKIWSTVEDDLVRLVCDFFESSTIPKGCNRSFIALIPKI